MRRAVFFFSLYSGKFKIEYELNVGNHYTILDELDFIACPTGVERRFECLEAAPGKKEGLMLGIVSGDSTAAVPTFNGFSMIAVGTTVRRLAKRPE